MAIMLKPPPSIIISLESQVAGTGLSTSSQGKDEPSTDDYQDRDSKLPAVLDFEGFVSQGL